MPDSWKKLHDVAASEGIVATAYERKQGEFSRMHQFVRLYLFHPSSAMVSCPLAMTDGAAKVLESFTKEHVTQDAFARLTSRDPEKFWTSGAVDDRTCGRFGCEGYVYNCSIRK